MPLAQLEIENNRGTNGTSVLIDITGEKNMCLYKDEELWKYNGGATIKEEVGFFLRADAWEDEFT